MASPRTHRCLLSIVLVAGAILGLPVPGWAGFQLPTHFSDDSIATGMDQPVGMAVLPDGRLLVVEKATARIRLFVKGNFAASDPGTTASSAARCVRTFRKLTLNPEAMARNRQS